MSFAILRTELNANGQWAIHLNRFTPQIRIKSTSPFSSRNGIFGELMSHVKFTVEGYGRSHFTLNFRLKDCNGD